VNVEGLPIKLWDRYLRDTVAEGLAKLQNRERVE